MSSTILTNWTVYYADDAAAGAGMKQIKWTGTTGTTSVNALYSALMDLFDNSAQNDYFDSIPIKAITPTLYEIGASDAGDRQPWFIDPDSVKHLTGAGLNTAKWSRDLSSRTGSHGIYKLTRSTTNIVAGDIGRTYTTSGTATGWILHVSGSNIWVRPTDGTATHDLGAITSITAGGHTDTITARVTAESTWANIYTLGTIADATEMVVYQNFTPLTQWWSTGHIDILVLITDFGTTIDAGILTVYARQYTKTYDHYVIAVPTGGRNPVPLASGPDANNTTGFWTVTLSGGSSTLFNVGNYMYVGSSWATATAKAAITAVNGSTLTYYLLGNLTNIANGNTVTEYVPSTGSNGDGVGTAGTPTAAGPAATPSSSLTVTFGASMQDINNGNGPAPYSVTLDLQNTISVSQLYERLKYLTRRGQTTNIDNGSQTVVGETYVGIGDIRLPYDTVSTSFVEGETINGQTSGATGVVTADHGTYLILRDVRGTFQDNENLRSGATVRALANIPSGAEIITPLKTAPFGTFAGGKFFGARGVYLANVPAAYANNYELIDTLGVKQVPPQSITLTVNGLVSGDQVAVFRTTGDNNTINKSMFTINSTTPVGTGVTQVRVNEVIPNDTPTTGSIRLVHRTAAGRIESEEKLTYSSWSNANQPAYSSFTVSSFTSTLDTTDTAYVPYIDTTTSSSAESVALIYVADRYVTCRVRRSGILPFMTKAQLTNTNLTITALRASDPIA